MNRDRAPEPAYVSSNPVVLKLENPMSKEPMVFLQIPWPKFLVSLLPSLYLLRVDDESLALGISTAQ